MFQLIDGIFNGLSVGSVLLISALGLAIVFGLMGVINLAHGELMMLGAYTTFVVQNLFKFLFGEDSLGLQFYFIFALPLGFLVAGLVGLLLEKTVIRHLYGRPLETLLATWGVSLILRQFVRSVNWALAIALGLFLLRGAIVKLIHYGAQKIGPRAKGMDGATGSPWERWLDKLSVPFGVAIAIGCFFGVKQWGGDGLNRAWFSARNVDVTAPQWLLGGVPMGNYQLPYSRMFIVVLTLLCLGGMYWFLNRSNWGLRIRSVTQNREMSACLGIPTDRVDALTFFLGSGLAGIAGCAVTLLGSVGPNTGQNYIVDAFMVVVVGGVGNIFGSVVAAIAIGVVNYLISSATLLNFVPAGDIFQPLSDFLSFFADSSMAKVMTFGLIIAFLQFKPAGIFPPKGRTAEL